MKSIFDPTLTPEEIEEMGIQARNEIQEIRDRGPALNSALVWCPPLLAAGLPVPRTEFVGFEPEQLWPTCDGQAALDSFPMPEIEKACERIGYPVFIRTDLSSAKHSGPEAYRANSKADLWRCCCLTFEDNALKDIASFARAFMVREWLDLPAGFTCFSGHPISREWRFFAHQTAVLCEHFYWPEDAFESYAEWSKEMPGNWRGILRAQSKPPDDLVVLRSMALKACQAIGKGTWSADFAADRSGKWWLTDMATAESSWHPDHQAQENP
jgi:hypothetical protein